ncbi:MAG TPA: hypothetical protein VF525_16850 [Pyrinomonadaceae bacterium]
MLMWLIIGSAMIAGSFLLALVSDGFAYGLSRGVEAAFDFLEYKAALRQARTRAQRSSSRLVYAAPAPARGLS